MISSHPVVDLWGPAELARRHDQSVVDQASLRQIIQQARECPVKFRAETVLVILQCGRPAMSIAVAVPGCSLEQGIKQVDGDAASPRFDQLPGLGYKRVWVVANVTAGTSSDTLALMARMQGHATLISDRDQVEIWLLDL